MPTLSFWKYQGAGNDFILIDQRAQRLLGETDQAQIAQLCDRHLGIGADGLMWIEQTAEADFRMQYFNADGRLGSLCGNGGRCAVAFARYLGITDETCRFLAYDGLHEARIPHPEWVELHLHDLSSIQYYGDDCCLDTGSPHLVRFVKSLDALQIREEGRTLRYSPPFKEKGINVNFTEVRDGTLHVATYERGVEDETLACGTGVTAAALAYVAGLLQPIGTWDIPIETKGGHLRVHFVYDGVTFRDIWLCGPAKQVFSGTFPLQ
jgi:diaminopimelate epimerase